MTGESYARSNNFKFLALFLLIVGTILLVFFYPHANSSIQLGSASSKNDFTIYFDYDGKETKYGGMFYDNSEDSFGFFQGLTKEPGSTVDIKASSFAYAPVVVGSLKIGDHLIQESHAGHVASIDQHLGIADTVQHGKLGIGTDTIPRAGLGSGIISVHGTQASASAGPHIQFTTDEDNRPALSILPWEHDQIAIGFDCYYGGTTSTYALDQWRSSDDGSSVLLHKRGDSLLIDYGTSAVGAELSFNIALSVDLTNGDVYVESGDLGVTLGDVLVTAGDVVATAGNVVITAGDLIITTPATHAASSTGVIGTIVWDTGYLYVCTATDTWERVALTGGY